MRVLCLTFGDHTRASTFYRIHQYALPLAAMGIHLDCIPARKFNRWNDIPGYDVVVLQKALLRAGKLLKLRRLSQRLIYDVDDAIWHPHGKKHFFLRKLREAFRFRTIVRAADLCTVANEVLAAHLKTLTPRVSLLPMALDERQWPERHVVSQGDKLRIGWSGHPVNFSCLQPIEPVLVGIQKRYPQTEVAVCSGEKPVFQSLKFVHLPFVPGAEPKAIRTFDIGLLPLPSDAFSQGKSPVKALQYLASGACVIASPVGSTQHMFVDGETALFAKSPEDWFKALSTLIEQPKIRQEMTRRGRKLFEERYSLTKATVRFGETLNNLAARH